MQFCISSLLEGTLPSAFAFYVGEVASREQRPWGACISSLLEGTLSSAFALSVGEVVSCEQYPWGGNILLSSLIGVTLSQYGIIHRC
jgi:hypothetical protein